LSSLGDALEALRSVILMQANIERVDEQVAKLADDMRGLRDYAVGIDKRLVRLETMVELTTGRRPPGRPLLEG